MAKPGSWANLNIAFFMMEIFPMKKESALVREAPKGVILKNRLVRLGLKHLHDTYTQEYFVYQVLHSSTIARASERSGDSFTFFIQDRDRE